MEMEKNGGQVIERSGKSRVIESYVEKDFQERISISI